MSKWVTKEKAKWFSLWHSTKERRLVTVASGSPIEVISTDFGFVDRGGQNMPVWKRVEYRVPFLCKYDSLAFVNMGAKQIDVNLKGNVGTSDGVSIEGKISIRARIADTECCIKRIVADPDEEERLLCDAVLTAMQETIASCTWHRMISFGEELAQTAQKTLSQLLDKTNSCFVVNSLTIQEVRPRNKALAELLEKAARTKEEEKLQTDITQLRVERAAYEKKIKEEELTCELRLQELRHQQALEEERKRLKLQQEKDDAQISTQKKLSELLKTEEGRIAALPKEMFGYLLKELEVKITDNKEREKLYREFLRTSQSFQAGQFNAMKALLAQHFGIRLSDESPMLTSQEEKETQQTNDKIKDETGPAIPPNS